MACQTITQILVIFIAAEMIALAYSTLIIDGKKVKTRRGRQASTSSDSADRKRKEQTEGDDDGQSLDLSDEISQELSYLKEHKDIPKSSAERKKWRKWHRKCPKCEVEMYLKWRDPTIQWVCGGYQRARRSFKSVCMMHFRNCQDGTMFTYLHRHKCRNDTNSEDHRHGAHFLYDYRVLVSGFTSGSTVTFSESSKSFQPDEEDEADAAAAAAAAARRKLDKNENDTITILAEKREQF